MTYNVFGGTLNPALLLLLILEYGFLVLVFVHCCGSGIVIMFWSFSHFCSVIDRKD